MPGRRDLDEQLREAIVDPELGDTRLERREGVEKRAAAAAIENRS